MFYFVKHGKTDYSKRNAKIYQGFGVNLSPMSELGIEQIKKSAQDERLKNADIILISPYTRALQTAAILSKELNIDIVVETDLHEWLANKNYIYDSDEIAENSYREYEANQGVYPFDKEQVWEDAKTIRKRVFKVLEKYSHYKKVIIACHGMMIQATAGGSLPKNGEIVEFNYEQHINEYV